MQRKINSILLSILMVIALGSCSGSKKTNKQENEITKQTSTTGPAVIIYKTKADYFDKVPVTLSEDKKEIVSYPGIKDVFFKGGLAYPTKLENEFLLDNRGIDENTAFLNVTYEAYSKMEKTPTATELFSNILDNDPFTELYHCGSRFDYKNVIDELNSLIKENSFDSFKKLK